MAQQSASRQSSGSTLDGPPVDPGFSAALDEMVSTGRGGHQPGNLYFNPPNQWLIDRMPIFQDLPKEEQDRVLTEAAAMEQEAPEANAQGRAASRVWPDAVVRLDNGGLAFFSQLGVARRPDLTQYFIEGFQKNRDALPFNEENQRLFTGVVQAITEQMKQHFASGQSIVQTDRQIGDAPGRSFHARQLLFGDRYFQAPLMWRQLTFDLPEDQWTQPPDILEVSIPNWLEDLNLPEDLKAGIRDSGLTQLVFKAPTKGLSLHLGFDYVGEHKMGPLSIAMFLVKQSNGLAVQAALSMSRVRTLDGNLSNTALVTVGPSLHGKSTLTINIELANSELSKQLDLDLDPEEGVYPMNDDIVLLQPLKEPIETTRGGHRVRISHGIDGTENNFYAVPYGLNREQDPITYDVLRGTPDAPNSLETLENVPVHVEDWTPNYMENPVRNMRMILSRRGLLARKETDRLLESITGGQLINSVHVPMVHTDRVLWQAVMRQNTVIPPLRRLGLEQYIRVLMYGEAVQMGAAIGAIGRPYVEYFSDPFIIGLEDENANLLHYILQQMARGGMPQRYYVFNTGGVGAETNDEASGPRYKKISRELTLMLQEAVLREAVVFEYDSVMGAEIGVAIVNKNGEEIVDLRQEWLPRNIYGETDYNRRVVELRRRRYYGRDSEDKAGILRYTKVTNGLIDLNDIPPPNDERQLAWLVSFYWTVDQPYNTLPELCQHLSEGMRPPDYLLRALNQMYSMGLDQELQLSSDRNEALNLLGIA